MTDEELTNLLEAAGWVYQGADEWAGAAPFSDAPEMQDIRRLVEMVQAAEREPAPNTKAGGTDGMVTVPNEVPLSDLLGPLPEPEVRHFELGTPIGFTDDQMRAYAAASVAADRERTAAEVARIWKAHAYAALGMQRDSMPPEDVEAVQRFLGPLGLGA